MNQENFRRRTEKAWDAFVEGEAELRHLLDKRNQADACEKMMNRCSEILQLAFDGVAFEMGVNGEKYELILSPEYNKVRLFELVYFRHHAPESILEQWNILVGRQPSHNFNLRSDKWEVSASDVQVWVEKQNEGQVGLTLYCEKLRPLLREDEGKAWWMLEVLLDQVLGEVPDMAVVDGFEVVDTPKDESCIPMENLTSVLKNMGIELSLNPQDYLDNSYLGYQMNPIEDPEAGWRMDVYLGTTRCVPLLNEFLNGESKLIDALERDGAVAGAFYYPLDSFDNEERSKKILDFRDELENAITEQAGEDAVVFIGGATGIYCGYLDFIAWDLDAVLKVAAKYFSGTSVVWSAFHSFRTDADVIVLHDHEREEN